MAFSQWRLHTAGEDQTNALAGQLSLPAFLARLLCARGYQTPEQARRFLHPESDEIEPPLSLSGMSQAVERIRRGLERGEFMAVYGDYDCDGIAATVLLMDYLENMGAQVLSVLPERGGDGYGLNVGVVERMAAQDITLLITVDNGISAVEEIARAKQLGMDVIVTDHHVPGPVLPDACAIIDPHLEEECTPFCGAGLALLLAGALEGGDLELVLEQYGDLAALATIGDVVPLIGGNRVLVQRGLPLLANPQRPGVAALLQQAGLSDSSSLTAQQVAFGLVPRINASGRMASPRVAYALLRTESPKEAEVFAIELEKLNQSRRAQESAMLADVQAMISSRPALLRRRVLCFAKEGWHPGVIGIAAARLCSQYGKPVFLLSGKEGVYTGSARSVGDFHLYKALLSCESVLTRFGGHRQAAGFTVQAENLQAFYQKLEEYARTQPPALPQLWLDGVLSPPELTPASFAALAEMEPFGEQNPVPAFLLPGVTILGADAVGREKNHTRFRMDFQGARFSAVQFGVSPERLFLSPGQTVDLAAHISLRPYQGKDYLSVQILELRPTGMKQKPLLGAQSFYRRFSSGERLSPQAAERLTPTRAQTGAVYRLLRRRPRCEANELYFALFTQMNYAAFFVSLDMLAEAGLVRFCAEGGYEIIENAPKADLTKTRTARALAKMRQGEGNRHG